MIIDCDTHFLPVDAFDYIEGELANQRPVYRYHEHGDYWDFDFQLPHLPGTTPLAPPGSGAHYKGISDIEVRMSDYEKMGIDIHFMLPQFTGWWSYLIEPQLATAMARSHNLAVLKLMQRYPGKILGVALIALQDPDGAVRELEWAWDNGFKGATVDKTFPVWEHPFGEPLGTHLEIWPFFQKAEELDIPIFIHSVQHGHRISNVLSFQRNGLDVFAPSEGSMTLVSLFTSGLLDALPKLKFIYTEAGAGWIKPLVQRLDATYKVPPVDYESEDPATRLLRRGATGGEKLQLARAFLPMDVYVEKNKFPPSHYFKNNFYFTIETEEPALADAVSFLGAEHFLFATDYPHDDPGGLMKFKDVELLRLNDKISEPDKELIRCDNAEKLFVLSLARV
jgi:predicted TIM-barrel fold metal-dependent hydrolase